MKIYNYIIFICCFSPFILLAQNITLSGHITTSEDKPLVGHRIAIVDSTGTSSIDYTDENGRYQFDGLFPIAYSLEVGDSEVKPNRANITMLDLVLISLHLLGERTIEDPYKLLAADVNASESATTFDLVTIRKFMFFLEQSFPFDAWTYIPKRLTSSSPRIRISPNFSHVEDGEHEVMDIIGIEMGNIGDFD